MIIKKFQGNTEAEAITKAKDELGKDAVVMNVKTIKPRGIMKLFKNDMVEITAALDENSNSSAGIGVKRDIAPSMRSGNESIDESAKMIKESAEAIRNIVEPQRESAPAPEAAPRQRTFEDSMRGFPPSPAPAPAPTARKENPDAAAGKALEENLERLQELLRAQIATEEQKGTRQAPTSPEPEPRNRHQQDKNSNLSFIKMLYNTLVENEVDEHYVNQIMDEIENVIHQDMQIDSVLSNLYQKLILKFGRPEGITLNEGRPKVVFLIGPTGVGKTTTVAKIASIFKLVKKKQVAFLTADTYRIAATEQLKVYADIIDSPISVVYSVEDMPEALKQLSTNDLILVDTAGYSHKNTEQQQEIKRLIDSVGEEYDREVYLVLSATTKYADLKSIVDAYKSVASYHLIFTKLDETDVYGNLLNVRMYSGAPVSYTTNGQNVPDDLEVFNSQKIVKLLLGGNA